MADFGSKIADFISKVPKNDLKLSKILISTHFFSEFFEILEHSNFIIKF